MKRFARQLIAGILLAYALCIAPGTPVHAQRAVGVGGYIQEVPGRREEAAEAAPQPVAADEEAAAAGALAGVRPRPLSLLRPRETSLPFRGTAVPEPGGPVLSLRLMDVSLGYVSAGQRVSLPIAAQLGLGDEAIWISDGLSAPEGISTLRVSLDTKQMQSADFPFTLANEPEAAATAVAEKTIVADGVNHGLALFDGLVVKEGVSAGSHPVLFNITWGTEDADAPQDMMLMSDVVMVRVDAACECCEHCVLCYDQATGLRIGTDCACLDAQGRFLGCQCECPFLIDPDDPASGWTDCGCDCHGYAALPDVTAVPQDAPYIGNYGPGVLVHTFGELRDAIADETVIDETRPVEDPARYRNLYLSGGLWTRTIYLGFNPAHQPAQGDTSFPQNPTLQNVFVPDGEEGIAVPAPVDHLVLVGTVNGMRVTVSDWGTRGGADSPARRGPGAVGRVHTIHNAAGRAGQRLTLRDANLWGDSPWGLFASTDAGTPVTCEYSSVDYVGRQLATNDTGPEGGVILENVSATLVSTMDAGGAYDRRAEAFVEADVCILRGDVTVTAEGRTDAPGLWLARAGGMLRVEAGAQLTAQAQGRPLIGGDASGYTLRLEDAGDGAGSRLVLSNGGGVSETALGAVYVGSGALMQVNPGNARIDLAAALLGSGGDIAVNGNLELYSNQGAGVGDAAVHAAGQLCIGPSGRLTVRSSGGGASPVRAREVVVEGSGTLSVSYAPLGGGWPAVAADRTIQTQAGASLDIQVRGEGDGAAMQAPTIEALGSLSIAMETDGSAMRASEEIRVDTLRIDKAGATAHLIDAPSVRFGAGQAAIEVRGDSGIGSVVYARDLQIDAGAVVSITQYAGADMLHVYDGGDIAVGGRLTAVKMQGAQGAMLRADTVRIGADAGGAQVRLIQQGGGDVIRADLDAGGSLRIAGGGALLYVHKARGTDAALNMADVSIEGVLQILQEAGDSALRNVARFFVAADARIDIARNVDGLGAVVSFAAGATEKAFTLDGPAFASLRNANGPMLGQAQGVAVRASASTVNYRAADRWHVWNNNLVEPFSFDIFFDREASGTVDTTLENGSGISPGSVPMEAQVFNLTAVTFQEMRVATHSPVQMQAVQEGATGAFGSAGAADRVAGYEYTAQPDGGYQNRYNSTGWEAAGGSEGFALSFPEPMLRGSRVYLVFEWDEQVNGQKFVVQAYACQMVQPGAAQNEPGDSVKEALNLADMLGLDALAASGMIDPDDLRLTVRILTEDAQPKGPQGTGGDDLATLPDHRIPLASPDSAADQTQPDRLILLWTMLL